MGLLKHLLLWPVTGPLFLTEFSLGKVQGVVRQELTDDSAVKAELLELQLQLELGDIDDEEYLRREAALMRRFREIREWRERFGMAVAGGLVGVAGSETPPSGDEALEEERVPESRPDEPAVADPHDATIDVNLDWE